ncbi:MAG: TM2 domain-containing protein [bacterium]|nr:TM2 domain-containing protein [bacterium]
MSDDNNITVVVQQAPPNKSKDKWIAFALCFFLGAFGAHKFYEGKTGMAVLYILIAFVLGPLTGFIAEGLLVIMLLVDLIVLICKPNPYTP